MVCFFFQIFVNSENSRQYVFKFSLYSLLLCTISPPGPEFIFEIIFHFSLNTKMEYKNHCNCVVCTPCSVPYFSSVAVECETARSRKERWRETKNVKWIPTYKKILIKYSVAGRLQVVFNWYSHQTLCTLSHARAPANTLNSTKENLFRALWKEKTRCKNP